MVNNLRYGNTLVTAGDHCKLVLSNEPSLDLAPVSEFLTPVSVQKSRDNGGIMEFLEMVEVDR